MGTEIFSKDKDGMLKKISKILSNVEIAMMVTVDEKGRMHSRPMVFQKNKFDGNLWFFSSDFSHKVAELSWNRQVHLNCINLEKSIFVAITGTGSIVRDRNIAKTLWGNHLSSWFPKGLNDPDLILIKVKVDRAEYWEVASPSNSNIIEMPSITTTDHTEIDLTG